MRDIVEKIIVIIMVIVLGIVVVNTIAKKSVDDVKTYCDTDKDVEYLIYKRFNNVSMTVRHDADGFVSRCKEEE